MNADQVQAAASVAATLLTGGVLWWEVHSRNRERRDAERAQARLIRFSISAFGSGTGDDQIVEEVRVTIRNHSTLPIFDCVVYLNNSLGSPGEEPLARWYPGDLAGNEELRFSHLLAVPVPPNRFGVDPRAALTDAAGLGWFVSYLDPEPQRSIWMESWPERVGYWLKRSRVRAKWSFRFLLRGRLRRRYEKWLEARQPVRFYDDFRSDSGTRMPPDP